ncbi:hypothetical protein Ahy_A02g008989 isoform F [Arachis hypogaea]|uniref:Uncharacterized protein n=1 Tax=Arachis hypogaea TaxID=3818 RepID=A0A445EFM2_ARAHY|nr:hypothetical protein Ahy_A02g008989 isoform F [Arachis hypogaea]
MRIWELTLLNSHR